MFSIFVLAVMVTCRQLKIDRRTSESMWVFWVKLIPHSTVGRSSGRSCTVCLPSPSCTWRPHIITWNLTHIDVEVLICRMRIKNSHVFLREFIRTGFHSFGGATFGQILTVTSRSISVLVEFELFFRITNHFCRKVETFAESKPPCLITSFGVYFCESRGDQSRHLGLTLDCLIRALVSYRKVVGKLVLGWPYILCVGKGCDDNHAQAQPVIFVGHCRRSDLSSKGLSIHLQKERDKNIGVTQLIDLDYIRLIMFSKESNFAQTNRLVTCFYVSFDTTFCKAS